MRNIHKLFNAVVFVFGMLFLAGNLAYGQVAVSLPNVSGQVGLTKVVPVTVGALASQGVTAVSFTITYDQTVVNITGINTTGTILDAYKNNLLVNTTVAGKITVVAAGTSALTGSGALINLNITPLKVGATPLTLSSFSFNEGTPAASLTNGNFTVPSLSITVPDTTVKVNVGGAFAIPVMIDDVTGKGVTSYTFTVTFDPAVIKLTGYSTAGTLSSGITSFAVNSLVAGKLTISAAGTAVLVGKGALLNLTGTSVAAGKSTVVFSNVLFNEGNPAVGSVDGSVTIGVNAKPAFTKTLKDTTIAENQALAFTYMAADPNADTVTFSVVGTLPTGATLNAKTGVLAWTPAYDQAGAYTIVVKAADALGLYDSTSAKITVTNLNRKPVLAVKAPAQKIDSVTASTNIYFKTTATDPDADAITYTWKLNGAVVKTGADSLYTGLFPTVGSSQVVICVFADGKGGSDSVSWSFKVVKSNPLSVETYTGVPTEFVVGQNYPNPFNPTTSIKFGLPKAAPVTLEIYNVLGEKVRTLLNGTVMSASFHNVSWDGKNDNGSSVTSGMYLYRITSDKNVQTMKMMLMK